MAWKLLAVLAVVCLVASFGQQSAATLLCPSVLPWCPKWESCNYTEVQGATCKDCNTRLICTEVGGLARPCWLPGRPHCVDGECAAQPSGQCAHTTVPDTTEAASPTTAIAEGTGTEDFIPTTTTSEGSGSEAVSQLS